MDQKPVMIDVDHVTIRFNLSNQKVDNIKEYFDKLVKRELMFQEYLAVKDVSLSTRLLTVTMVNSPSSEPTLAVYINLSMAVPTGTPAQSASKLTELLQLPLTRRTTIRFSVWVQVRATIAQTVS